MGAARYKRKTSGKVRLKDSLLFRFGFFSVALFTVLLLSFLAVTIHLFGNSFSLLESENLSGYIKSYMQSLKESHSKEKEIIALQLDRTLGDEIKKGSLRVQSLNKSKIKELVEIPSSQKIIFNTDLISQLNVSPSENQIVKPVQWQNQSTLRIFNFTVPVKSNDYEQKYLTAQNSMRKVQIFEYKVRHELVSVLTRTAALVVAVFLALSLGFYMVKGRGVQQRLQRFFNGMKTWSEGNLTHREAVTANDEIGVMQTFFNDFANQLAATREKSADIERISQWQTVARKMAHEIKNPLTPIQMIFNRLKTKYPREDEYALLLTESKKMIYQEIGGLRRLVDSFTEFASLPVTKAVPLEIDETVREVISKLKIYTLKHEILFENRMPADTIWPHDRDLISVVLTNLIKNAVEACDPTPSQIWVRILTEDSKLAIEVEDNGPGVPPEIQKDIFNPHFSTKTIGSSSNISDDSGMGLGLSICKKIVYDHGGEITVKSRPHQTIFKFTLGRH